MAYLDVSETVRHFFDDSVREWVNLLDETSTARQKNGDGEESILFAADGHVRLSLFGLLKYREEAHQTGAKLHCDGVACFERRVAGRSDGMNEAFEDGKRLRYNERLAGRCS